MLRRLGHVSADGIVLTKGRAACEIDTADELLTTELMFNGVFNGLDKHQLVALASCLIPMGEKSAVRLQQISHHIQANYYTTRSKTQRGHVNKAHQGLLGC